MKAHECAALAEMEAALKHTATHCNTLQHITVHGTTLHHKCTNTLKHTRAQRWWGCRRQSNTLQHIATHCNTLQHTATHCTALVGMQAAVKHTATHCDTLQHTATHCTALVGMQAALFACPPCKVVHIQVCTVMGFGREPACELMEVCAFL